MGKWKVSVDRDNDLTILTASGTITASGIYSAVKKYLADKPSTRLLFDLADADGSDISGDDFRTLHMKISKLPNTSESKKVAVVVSRDLGYGLSRLSATYAQLSGIEAEHRIFRCVEDAMRWLEKEKTI